MILRAFAGAVLMSVCCTLAAQEAQRPQPLKSGLDFTGPEVQELQKDDFANPGGLDLAQPRGDGAQVRVADRAAGMPATLK